MYVYVCMYPGRHHRTGTWQKSTVCIAQPGLTRHLPTRFSEHQVPEENNFPVNDKSAKYFVQASQVSSKFRRVYIHSGQIQTQSGQLKQTRFSPVCRPYCMLCHASAPAMYSYIHVQHQMELIY